MIISQRTVRKERERKEQWTSVGAPGHLRACRWTSSLKTSFLGLSHREILDGGGCVVWWPRLVWSFWLGGWVPNVWTAIFSVVYSVKWLSAPMVFFHLITGFFGRWWGWFPATVVIDEGQMPLFADIFRLRHASLEAHQQFLRQLSHPWKLMMAMVGGFLLLFFFLCYFFNNGGFHL